MCYLNSTLQGLAWLTLICDGLHADMWQKGFEVIQALTMWTPVPLNVGRLAALQELLCGDWGPDDLARQHDQLDFLCHILLLAQPCFINGG